MKVNCKALKLSIKVACILFIVSVILVIVSIYCINQIIESIRDVFLGSFISSIIMICFYISAYNVEKKKTLGQYWIECRKMLVGINTIEYLNINYNKEVFVKLIYEQKDKLNKENLKYTKLIKNRIKLDDKKYLENLTEKEEKDFLEEKIKRMCDKTINEMNKIIGQYLNYLNLSMDNMNILLDDIEFFNGDSDYYKAYELFQELFELREKIWNATFYFRCYKEGKINFVGALDKLLELQESIFEVKESENSKKIYNYFSDRMEEKLEEFRAKVIYNIKPTKIEKIPNCTIIKN